MDIRHVWATDGSCYVGLVVFKRPNVPPVHSYVIISLVTFSFLIGSLAWHATASLLADSHSVSASTRPAYLHPKRVKQRRNPPSLLIESQERGFGGEEGGGATCSEAESAENASSQQAPLATGEDVGKDDFVFLVLFCFFFLP